MIYPTTNPIKYDYLSGMITRLKPGENGMRAAYGHGERRLMHTA